MTKFPAPIQKLIMQLRKLPGVGAKTAERFAFELLAWEPGSLELLSHSLRSIQAQVHPCPSCFCLKGEAPCEFCDPIKRDPSALCIVSHSKDIYPIEETKAFKGVYHVLGGLLSPLQGYNTDQIDMEKIKERIRTLQVKDVILALDSTLEGDATSLFLKEELAPCDVTISRLAFGIPLGSSLDYVDAGTLTRALLGRRPF
jgi:recombination protein RecR